MLRTTARGLLQLIPRTRTVAPRLYSSLPPNSSSTSPSSPTHLNVPSHASPRPQKHSKSKKSKSQSSSASIAPPFPRSTTSQLQQLLPQLHASSNPDRLGPADGKAIALTTAESYDTRVLLKSLEQMGLLNNAVNLLGEAILLPKWSPPEPTYDGESGEVFIFESGTIVLWGLSMNGAQQFLSKVIRGSVASLESIGWVEQGRYSEPETEVLEYWVSSGKGPTRMSGDSILLSSPPSASLPSTSTTTTSTPSKDLLERLAFSAGMARVTKLGVYEEQFDEFAEGVSDIPKLLQSGSESPVKKTDIIKRVGTLHQFRQKLNLEDENLLDEPEFLWEDAALHGHYTSVCKALEFETRLETLNDRVDYAFSLQTTLMELLNAQTSHRLEWIIIILIAFEISLVLYREGLPFVKSSSEEGEKKKSSH